MQDSEIGLITALCAVFDSQEWKSCNKDARKRVIDYFSARVSAEMGLPAESLQCIHPFANIIGPKR